MSNIIGKPNVLKQVNLSVVRKAIKERGSATRAEIVKDTKISVTTVRTLLTEMLFNNEITDAGYDKSIGGRKATRYALNKERFFGVALCLGSEEVRYITVNICGEIQESGSFETAGDGLVAIFAFLDNLFARLEIKSIGIGVPGVVSGMGYQKGTDDGTFEHYPIGEVIGERYGVPVILENDLNAITLGFGRCFLKSFPEERCDNLHMAYIHFDNKCVSAGFLSGGKILRGWNNFSGELGLFPISDNKALDSVFTELLSDAEYSQIVMRIMAGICCVLNPEYIAIGGSGFRKACLPLITECFNSVLPDRMSAEIVYAEDIWHDYFGGMAYLTAEQIFANVMLIKE